MIIKEGIKKTVIPEETQTPEKKKSEAVFWTTENIGYFSLGALLLIYSMLWFTVFGPSVTKMVMKTESRMLIIWLSPFLYFISCGAIYFLFVKKFKTHGQAPAVIFFFIFGLMIAGVNYYNERPNLKAQETEVNRILAEAYYEKAQKFEPGEPGLMSMPERQVLISQLEQKAFFLEKARQYTERYTDEYQMIVERLQLERSLAKYEAEFGPAQEIKLTEKGKWLLACAIPDDSMIYYLSLNDFKKRDNVNKEKIWPASSPQKYTRYNIWGSEKLNIEFSMNDKPAHIFYWPRKS